MEITISIFYEIAGSDIGRSTIASSLIVTCSSAESVTFDYILGGLQQLESRDLRISNPNNSCIACLLADWPFLISSPCECGHFRC
jgi:hypothetical protein